MKNMFLRGLSSKPAKSVLFKELPGAGREIYFVSVNPLNVRGISLLPREPYLTGLTANTGIFGGAWDWIKKSAFRDVIYQTVQELLNGADVKQTAKFNKTVKEMSEEKAFVHTNKINTLVDQLSTMGYMSQYQLGGLEKLRRIGEFRVPGNEIVIGMDRKGEYLRLMGGRHRLAIAQQIGIKSIPAILTIIHKKAVNKLPEKCRIITGNPEDYRPF